MLNKLEILVFVWILKIASAKIGATDSLVTLPLVSYSSFGCAGIEFVTITWSSYELAILSRAFPVNNP